jgi:DNA-binding MarR family transcriptional regulator
VKKDWDETGRNWIAPGLKGEKLRFHDFPAFHFMGLAGLVKHAMMHKYLEPWGLSMPEWRLLSTVAEASPIRFARIAQLTAMDKAQVSRALRTAQGKGLVETGVWPGEKRESDGDGAGPAGRIQVSLTPAGREIYEKVMPLAQRDQLRLIELMSPEERRMVLQLTQRIFNLLQADLERDSEQRSFRTDQSDLAAGKLAQPA